MKFVDVRNDVAFKKIFGNENRKEILISFLNAVLYLSGDKVIEDITILNPWQAPKLPNLKDTILDIRAIDKKKITFIVEIQIQRRPGFLKRVLYYTSNAYVVQLEKGDDYSKLKRVIFIGIMDFNMFKGSNYLTRHLILNTTTLTQELKDLEFNFIELPKFTKDEPELESVTDKWIYFIKNAYYINMVPKCADFTEIQKAYDIANLMQWSKDDRDLYDYWHMRDLDDIGTFREGKREGLLKGIEGMLEIKYAEQGCALMDKVSNLESVERLEEFQQLIKRSVSIDELRGFLQ
ncbi:hypothetical protein MBAV_000822 [Candidatus Magnetobacterium bavaricum]|uniref:Transposase n=1 Tax=Candidatus Magnetobacterium bavaricum TaxID=29290 RepID=A0A0F3GYM9_9BACT|nr:hypothetical protein MBAV_000822 [Candidatus Magnetobacterium bavaricum]